MSNPRLVSFLSLRYTLRALRHRKAFTAAAVLTLALGIGAATAIFAVVYGVLIKPLPYPNAHELVSLQHTAVGRDANVLIPSQSMFVTYTDENRTFQQVGLWNAGGRTLTGLGEPEQLRSLWVTNGTLQALGVGPRLGRSFTDDEHRPGAQGPQPVIISHAFWQRRFAGDESAVGRALTLDGQPAQIVGVMPAGFRFLAVTPQPDVINAWYIDRSDMFLANFNFAGGVARLKPGVTLAEANTDVARMLPIWLNAWPAANGPPREAIENWRIAPALVPMQDDIVGNVAGTLWLLMGAVGAVLLIACANVANLLLVRADARRQELAIRAALGAGRGRIATEILTESLVLGVLGGAAGLALATAGIGLLARIGPTSLPRLQDIAIDPKVLAFAAGASLVSSLLFGAIPAFKHAFNVDALGAGSRGASTSREHNRARNALIVVQVALALVLLVGAGLMIRTFQALNAVEPGIVDPSALQIVRIWTQPVQRDPARSLRLQRDILERIEAIPGVTAAAFGFGAPLEQDRLVPGTIRVEGGREYAASDTPPGRYFRFVTPGYLATAGTRLVAGRDIAWTDVEQGGQVAMVSASVARELWGEPSAALGKRIRESATGVWREVIGVTQDVHEMGVDRAAPPIVYWPIQMQGFNGQSTFGWPPIAYTIRSDRAGSASFVGEVQRAVWSANGDLPVFLIRTVGDLFAASMARTSFTLVLLGIAGAMALCLGIVGIYGVISYVVAQRTREVGIRLALGARPAVVRRMFVAQGLTLAALGAVVGLAVSVVLGRSMASLLFGVQPLDPPTYAAVLGVLAAAVVLATYVPARRASAVDPAVTLKAE